MENEIQLYDREMYVALAKDFAERYNYKNVSEHIVDVMVSVMRTRDGNWNGGGFVQSILENNLDEACSRADAECIKYLRLFSLIKKYGHIRQNI